MWLASVEHTLPLTLSLWGRSARSAAARASASLSAASAASARALPPPVTDQASHTNRRGLESIFQGLEPITRDWRAYSNGRWSIFHRSICHLSAASASSLPGAGLVSHGLSSHGCDGIGNDKLFRSSPRRVRSSSRRACVNNNNH
eukprot:7882925-Pyramimonas_sp.AAC.3